LSVWQSVAAFGGQKPPEAETNGPIPGSFAGLGFLSWYLAGKVKAFDRRGHVAKLCVVLLPLLLAAMVAVSRVDDYWHHWQDVFAGGILGRHFPDTSSFNCLTCTPSAYRLSSLLQGWWLRLSATFSFSHRHLVNKVRAIICMCSC
jgi:hypothetical protein